MTWKNEKVDYQIYNVYFVGIKDHMFYAKLINPHLKLHSALVFNVLEKYT